MARDARTTARGRRTAIVTTRHARNLDVSVSYQVHNKLMFWRPWLVLIQGVGFDAAGWGPVLRRLRRRFRLIVLNNRGFDSADAPAGWYTVATMVADAVAVLDAEGVRSAHILGVSLGGMVAQELAIAHPDRVERLVLVSTTPGWPCTYPMPAPSGRLLALAPVLPREAALRRQVENMISPHSIAERPRLVGRLLGYRRTSGHDRRSSQRQMLAGATYLGGLRQQRIRAETLVLHGSADTVADPRNAARLAEQIPSAQLVMFPDAGHLLSWEHPDEFVEVVSNFLLHAPTGQTDPATDMQPTPA
jgi:3-oxoadipate enol-lactonase